MTATTDNPVVTHVDFGGQQVRDTEPHPFRHKFSEGSIRDEIVEKNARGVPLLIRRNERCDWCGCKRVHYIDVTMWQRYGGYQYRERPKGLRRMSSQEWTRREFLRTTDLDDKVKARLEKVGIRAE
jgi:hypothetical protein